MTERQREREREREGESNRRRKKQFRIFLLLLGLNLHKCEKSNTSPYLCTLQLSGMINEINQGLDFRHLLFFYQPSILIPFRLPFILITDCTNLVHRFKFWIFLMFLFLFFYFLLLFFCNIFYYLYFSILIFTNINKYKSYAMSIIYDIWRKVTAKKIFCHLCYERTSH